MNKNSGFSNLQVIILIAVSIVLALLAGIYIGKDSVNKKNTEENMEEGELDTISDEEFQERLSTSVGIKYTVDGEDSSENQDYKAEVSTELKKLTAYLRDNNAYVGVQVSDEDYDTYIYNNNNEVFLERTINGTNTIYLNDGSKYMIYNGQAVEVEDIDILSLVDLIADTINGNKSIVYKLDTTESVVGDETNYEGYLLLNGWNEIYNFYSKIGEQYATDLVKSLMNETTGDCAVLFDFRFSTDRKISLASLVVMRNENKTEDNNDEFTTLTNWQFNGYEVLDSWKLDNEWYTVKDVEDYNYSDLLESTYTTLEKVVGVEAEDTTDSSDGSEQVDDSSETSTDTSENETSDVEIE